MAENMTNQQWLATLSPGEWYRTIVWLFQVYGRRYDNSQEAIMAWLKEKHE